MRLACIRLILFAIVWKVASAAVETPLPVTAAAIRALPSLTEDFKDFNSVCKEEICDIVCVCPLKEISLPNVKALVVPITNLLDFRKRK